MSRKKHSGKIRSAVLAGALFWALASALPVYAYDDEVYWDGASACWDEVYDAERYQVQLYRDGQQIASRTTGNNWYDFRDVMKRSGDYRFRVRERIDGEYGSWSSYSDYYTLDGSTSASPERTTSSSGSSGQKASNDSVQSIKTPKQDTVNRLPVRMGWQQDDKGWWYRYADGNYAKNSWQYLDGKWYNFDEKGYLRTGWIYRAPVWFYSLSDGSMATGWQNINEKWYYFSEENGFMLTDTMTPDGRYVGTDGAWQPE